jgi:hypothetical protein
VYIPLPEPLVYLSSSRVYIPLLPEPLVYLSSSRVYIPLLPEPLVYLSSSRVYIPLSEPLVYLSSSRVYIPLPEPFLYLSLPLTTGDTLIITYDTLIIIIIVLIFIIIVLIFGRVNILLPGRKQAVDLLYIYCIYIYTSSLAFEFGPQIEMENKVFQNHFLIDMKPDSESPRVNLFGESFYTS